MLKKSVNREKLLLMSNFSFAPDEQFLFLSTIFSYLMVDFYVKTRTRISLRDKQLFEISEVEMTRVDYTLNTK